MRVAICGVVNSGKTTLSDELEVEHPEATIRHADDLIYLGWSGASAMCATFFDDEGDLVVEGMAVPRALRKWLHAHPDGPPVDTVLWLGEAHKPLSVGQRSMSKGARKVLGEIVDELRSRGTAVVGL